MIGKKKKTSREKRAQWSELSEQDRPGRVLTHYHLKMAKQKSAVTTVFQDYKARKIPAYANKFNCDTENLGMCPTVLIKCLLIILKI